MSIKSSQQISLVLVPNLGLIRRTTGKQMSGVERHCCNPVAMASKGSQLTSEKFRLRLTEKWLDKD